MGGKCGHITINGGPITAQRSDESAGIGGGGGPGNKSCGNITISPAVGQVRAAKGKGASNSIGADRNGSCGTVTIGGTLYWDGGAYQNNGNNNLTSNPLVYPAS